MTLGDHRIESRTIVWAAGVAASPAAQWLGAAHDRLGRVIVEPDLTFNNHVEVFVIGDTALVKALPGLAPVAKQQMIDAASLVCARLSGSPPRRRFAIAARRRR